MKDWHFKGLIEDDLQSRNEGKYSGDRKLEEKHPKKEDCQQAESKWGFGEGEAKRKFQKSENLVVRGGDEGGATMWREIVVERPIKESTSYENPKTMGKKKVPKRGSRLQGIR